VEVGNTRRGDQDGVHASIPWAGVDEVPGHDIGEHQAVGEFVGGQEDRAVPGSG